MSRSQRGISVSQEPPVPLKRKRRKYSNNPIFTTPAPRQSDAGPSTSSTKGKAWGLPSAATLRQIAPKKKPRREPSKNQNAAKQSVRQQEEVNQVRTRLATPEDGYWENGVWVEGPPEPEPVEEDNQMDSEASSGGAAAHHDQRALQSTPPLHDAPTSPPTSAFPHSTPPGRGPHLSSPLRLKSRKRKNDAEPLFLPHSPDFEYPIAPSFSKPNPLDYTLEQEDEGQITHDRMGSHSTHRHGHSQPRTPFRIVTQTTAPRPKGDNWQPRRVLSEITITSEESREEEQDENDETMASNHRLVKRTKHKTYSKRIGFTYRDPRLEEAFDEPRFSQHDFRSQHSEQESLHDLPRPRQRTVSYHGEYPMSPDTNDTHASGRVQSDEEEPASDMDNELAKLASLFPSADSSWDYERRHDPANMVPVTRAFEADRYHYNVRPGPPQKARHPARGGWLGPELPVIFEEDVPPRLQFTQTIRDLHPHGRAKNHQKYKPSRKRRQALANVRYLPERYVRPISRVPIQEFVARYEDFDDRFPVDPQLLKLTHRAALQAPYKPPRYDAWRDDGGPSRSEPHLPRFAHPSDTPSEPIASGTTSTPTERFHSAAPGRLNLRPKKGQYPRLRFTAEVPPARLGKHHFTALTQPSRTVSNVATVTSATSEEVSRVPDSVIMSQRAISLDTDSSRPQRQPSLRSILRTRSTPAQQQAAAFQPYNPPTMDRAANAVLDLEFWQMEDRPRLPPQPSLHPDDMTAVICDGEEILIPSAEAERLEQEWQVEQEVAQGLHDPDPINNEDFDPLSQPGHSNSQQPSSQQPRMPLGDVTANNTALPQAPDGHMSGLNMTDYLLRLAEESRNTANNARGRNPRRRMRRNDEKPAGRVREEGASTEGIQEGNGTRNPHGDAGADEVAIQQSQARRERSNTFATASARTREENHNAPQQNPPRHGQRQLSQRPVQRQRSQHLMPNHGDPYQRHLPRALQPNEQNQDQTNAGPSRQTRSLPSDSQPPNAPVAPRTRTKSLYTPFKQPTRMNATPPPEPTAADLITSRLAAKFPSFGDLLPRSKPPPPPKLGARARWRSEGAAITKRA